jgi:hypothetical protein
VTLLRGFWIDPSRSGDRVADRSLLEAIAVRCAICLGGRSYAENELTETTLSTAVEVTFSGPRPKRSFLWADRPTEAVARAGRLTISTTPTPGQHGGPG